MKRAFFAFLSFAIGSTAFLTPALSVSGTLEIKKACSKYTGEAGSFCMIIASNCDAIAVGSKIVYKEAAASDGGLDTDVVITTPSGDSGYGHVVLDGKTETGTVTLTGGTGQLEKLEGKLVVAPLDKPNYSWSGPYSY